MGIAKSLIDAFDGFGRARAARMVYHELSSLGADELARHGINRDELLARMKNDANF